MSGMIKFTLAVLFLTCTGTLVAKGLEVGADAPKVSALDQDGNPVDLGKVLGEGTTVVFFYPKADTPGCTKQACSLGEGFMELKLRGVKVYGVSGDSTKAQAKFKQKYSLPYPLLADSELKVSEAFGKGRWARQAYIFQDGKVVWADHKAATANQFEEVLAALDELGIAPKASI